MSDNFTPLDALKLGQLVSGTSQPKTSPVTHRPSPEAPPIVIQQETSAPETPQLTESKKDEVKEDAAEAEPAPEQAQAPVSQFVQEVKDEVEVPPELIKVGLKPVAQSDNPAYQNVKLPISDEKVMEGLDKPPTSSYRWLAELCRYMLRLAHIQLKKVHGHVIRVFKP